MLNENKLNYLYEKHLSYTFNSKFTRYRIVSYIRK